MKARLASITAAGLALLMTTTAIGQAPAPQSTQTPASAPAAKTVPVGVEPRVLTATDAALYQKVFELQRGGNWAEADKHIKKIQDTVLMGHVLHQRYMHPTKYRSSYIELRDWMTLYADYPEADEIYALAMKRKPRKEVAPVPPVPQRYVPPVTTTDAQPLSPQEQARRARAAQVRASIASALAAREPERAESLLKAVKGKDVLDDAAYGSQLSLIAKGYYFNQKYKKALDLGDDAVDKGKGDIAEGAWVAGLSAWRMGKFGKAARMFEKTWDAPDSGTQLGVAGAYWAARAHIKEREPEKAVALLEKAAEARRTFYGILAARQLGIVLPYDWTPPTITQGDLNEALYYPGARRAVALAQIGDQITADEEMRLAMRRLGPDVPRDGLVKVAARLDFIGAAVTLARFTERKGGAIVEPALFPTPSWQPEDGFKLDRALLYAFMRQESNFMVRATSSAGARGLMQLMPATAGYIAGDNSLKDRNSERLYDPSFNMKLGQKYLMYLFDKGVTQNNLILVAASYNAGPGNVAKWLQRDDSGNDWLLFMESIPIFETRAYVEHVLENLWVYRARFGQPSPSLDAMVVGAAPTYDHHDSRELALQ